MQQDSTKQSRDEAVPKRDGAALLVDFANMNDDEIPRFRKRWARSYGRYTNGYLLKRRDELRLLWRKQVIQSVLPDVIGGRARHPDEGRWLDEFDARTSAHNRRLYSSWDARDDEGKPILDTPLQEFICTEWLRLNDVHWVVHWKKKRSIQANRRSLPAVLTWLCVDQADRLGYCRNPDCPAPYILVRRRDQRYCSPECAGPAQREAKRRSWHKRNRERASPKNSARKMKPTKGGKK